MNPTIAEFLLIPSAYLLGSVSSAIIVCKLMQLPDPRTQGSGNPGATNVLRFGGKKAAAITLTGDVLKGFIPALLAMLLNFPAAVLALVGLAAFVGHLYPVFFRFTGGKGVATLLGVLFGWHWAVGAATGVTWLLIAKVFKISSVAGLIAALLAPFYVWLLLGPHPSIIGVTFLMTILLYWRHRQNIQQLFTGKEGKIGKSSDH
ncbi:MAG: glycerol-3-phosphate 1-O-acyltransferase PlsY [Gammaproteobacteria bacterium]|nr:glycerol-3-phosphate 1-O-acyltransferase PlsY [Gammaproteobacteria bacterium]